MLHHNTTFAFWLYSQIQLILQRSRRGKFPQKSITEIFGSLEVIRLLLNYCQYQTWAEMIHAFYYHLSAQWFECEYEIIPQNFEKQCIKVSFAFFWEVISCISSQYAFEIWSGSPWMKSLIILNQSNGRLILKEMIIKLLGSFNSSIRSFFWIIWQSWLNEQIQKALRTMFPLRFKVILRSVSMESYSRHVLTFQFQAHLEKPHSHVNK